MRKIASVFVYVMLICLFILILHHCNDCNCYLCMQRQQLSKMNYFGSISILILLLLIKNIVSKRKAKIENNPLSAIRINS